MMVFKNKNAQYGYARSSTHINDLFILFRYTFVHSFINGLVANHQELIVCAVRITNDTDTNEQIDLVINQTLNEITENQNSSLTLYYHNSSEGRNIQYRFRETVDTSIGLNRRNIIQSNSRIDSNRLTHALGFSLSLELPQNRHRCNVQPSPYIMVSSSRDMEGISPFDYDHNEHQSRNNACITMHESPFIDIHDNRPDWQNSENTDTTRRRILRTGAMATDNYSHLLCSMSSFFRSCPPNAFNSTPNNNYFRDANRSNSYSSNSISKQKRIVSELSELNRTEDKIDFDKSNEQMQRYSSVVHRQIASRPQSRRKRYKQSYNRTDVLDCGRNTATGQDITGQNTTNSSVFHHDHNNRIINHQTIRTAISLNDPGPVMTRTVDSNDETNIQSRLDTNIGEYGRDIELQQNSLPEAARSLIDSGHNEHNVRTALARFYQTRGHYSPTLSDLRHVLVVEMSCEIDDD